MEEVVFKPKATVEISEVLGSTYRTLDFHDSLLAAYSRLGTGPGPFIYFKLEQGVPHTG